MQDWPEALGVRCTAQQGASRFPAGDVSNMRTVRIAVQAIMVLASAAGASGIAVGELTHSARVLDIGLDLQTL